MLTGTKKPRRKSKTPQKVRDYGNDPFFVKKAKESKDFLERHGFPKELQLKK
jgi:hypothetical protein